MRNIIEICFKKGGRINRKEYLLANIFLVVVSVLWVAVSTPIFMAIGNPLGTIFYTVIPMLIFYTYGGLLITWKRGKDFCKNTFWIYLFSIIIIIATWIPVLALINPLWMFNPVVFILATILHIVWMIMWLVFQFSKTKIN